VAVLNMCRKCASYVGCKKSRCAHPYYVVDGKVWLIGVRAAYSMGDWFEFCAHSRKRPHLYTPNGNMRELRI